MICFGQKENANWYFGDSAGVKFISTGVVPILNSPMRMYNSGATISDSLGNLLFYTQSQTIWNKNNDTMENGYGIKPHYVYPVSQDWAISTDAQGALIIPVPDNPNLYYLFSLDYGKDSTLVVSKIDMLQNGGLGKVVSKNHFIYLDSLSEQMTAVKHGNGRDWWLITHEWFSSRFVKFLITPDSIEGPFFQEIGNSLDTLYFAGYGQSCFSPNGDKYLVVVSQGIMKLFDFNRCTGKFSNMVDLSTPPYPYTNNKILYGSSFSPDGKKIYISSLKRLIQFDLDSANIQSTRDTIWINNFVNYNIYGHDLGIDGRIYFANGFYFNPNTAYSVHNTNLSIIDSPNNKGSLCHVILDTISLAGNKAIGGLPNLVNYSLGKLTSSSACDTIPSVTAEIKNQNNSVSIFPNPASEQLTVYTNQLAVNAICITDALGKIVLNLSPVSKSVTQLDIKSLASGVYFVKVKMQEGSVTVKKFVRE